MVGDGLHQWTHFGETILVMLVGSLLGEQCKVSRILGEMGSEGWVDTVKVHGGMILVGAGYGGYNVLTKVALTGGVDPFVYPRTAIGCMALFVYTLYFERCHQS